jgi:hypothetical protein
MSLISAGSISLDSTFNREAQIQVQFRLAVVGGTPMAALMASWNTWKDILVHILLFYAYQKSIIVDWRRLHFLKIMMKDDIQDWILRPVDCAGIFEKFMGLGTEYE